MKAEIERTCRIVSFKVLPALLSVSMLDTLESNAGLVPDGRQQFVLFWGTVAFASFLQCYMRESVRLGLACGCCDQGKSDI